MKIVPKEEANHEIRYVFCPSPLIPNKYEYWSVQMWMVSTRQAGEHVAWVKAKNGEEVPGWLKRDWFSGKLKSEGEKYAK